MQVFDRKHLLLTLFHLDCEEPTATKAKIELASMSSNTHELQMHNIAISLSEWGNQNNHNYGDNYNHRSMQLKQNPESCLNLSLQKKEAFERKPMMVIVQSKKIEPEVMEQRKRVYSLPNGDYREAPSFFGRKNPPTLSNRPLDMRTIDLSLQTLKPIKRPSHFYIRTPLKRNKDQLSLRKQQLKNRRRLHKVIKYSQFSNLKNEFERLDLLIKKERRHNSFLK